MCNLILSRQFIGIEKFSKWKQIANGAISMPHLQLYESNKSLNFVEFILLTIPYISLLYNH